jgi:hypothetical protein
MAAYNTSNTKRRLVLIDALLTRLLERDRPVPLGEFEGDFWRRAQTRAIERRTRHRLAISQAAIVVVATLGSAAAGIASGGHAHEVRISPLLPAVDRLAPSTLLFGPRP